jgi:hypothetical protein
MCITKAAIIEEFGESGVPKGLADEHFLKAIDRAQK